MRGIARRHRAGITLIELMVTIVLLVLMAAAVASAFTAGLDTERRRTQGRTEQEEIAAMEQRITRLLQGAVLSSNAQDRTTYFIGDNVGDTLDPLPQTGTQAGGAVSAPTNTLRSAASGEEASDLTGCTRLTFTSVAPTVPMRLRTDTNDFETQQQQNGPEGGVAEIALSTAPTGDAGERTGLFERIQRPSDGDPGQGGMESVLFGSVRNIAYEFWNGTDWAETWNTTTVTGRRLPAAVQVSYELRTDAPGVVRRFVVPIPNSDVTALNPVATATTGTGAAQ